MTVDLRPLARRPSGIFRDYHDANVRDIKAKRVQVDGI